MNGHCTFCGAGPREYSECEDVRCNFDAASVSDQRPEGVKTEGLDPKDASAVCAAETPHPNHPHPDTLKGEIGDLIEIRSRIERLLKAGVLVKGGFVHLLLEQSATALTALTALQSEKAALVAALEDALETIILDAHARSRDGYCAIVDELPTVIKIRSALSSTKPAPTQGDAE